jgi:hypothetical protein
MLGPRPICASSTPDALNHAAGHQPPYAYAADRNASYYSTMHTERSSNCDSLVVSNELRRFDFWLLWLAQIAALLGVYTSISGYIVRWPRAVFHYLLLSLVYAPSTAAIAATMARKVGLPALPVFENLRSGSVSIRNIAWPLLVVIVVGIIVSYSALFYDEMLTICLGSGVAPSNVFEPNALAGCGKTR